MHWVTKAWRPVFDEPYVKSLISLVNELVRPEYPGSADLILDRLAKSRASPPQYPTSTIAMLRSLTPKPCMDRPHAFFADVYEYGWSIKSLHHFAEQITLVFHDKIKAINPWALGLAWFQNGDFKCLEDQSVRLAYSGLANWVKESLLSVSPEKHCDAFAFWSQIGEVCWSSNTHSLRTDASHRCCITTTTT